MARYTVEPFEMPWRKIVRAFRAGVAQLVEHHLPKVRVVSSNLITRL